MEADNNALCKMYGLTRAEAALATVLAQGKTIHAAAEALCMDPHIARVQLNRILHKMNILPVPIRTSRTVPRQLPSADRSDGECRLLVAASMMT